MRRKWRRSWARSKPDQQPNRLVKSFQGITSWKTMAKCLLPLVAAAGLMINSMGITYALPTEVVTKAGNVTVSQSGNTMTVNETSATGIVNSKTFVINSNETLNIYQPSSSASLLWKVLGNDPSAIYGHLNATGQLFLYNPQGTLFARGAQVNVGSLVATSLNITDSDYLAGNYKFSGTDSSGTVVNQGTITAADGGYVALLAPQVANEGVIVAQQGTVALGAGSAVTLDLAGDGLLNLAVDKSAVDASAANHNLIQADGGQVIMTASTAGDLTRTAVNNSGVILARTANNVNGVIRLDGGTSGAVVNSGTLDASGQNPGATGGTVKVLGKEVTLGSTTKVDVSGDSGGGTALIGGNTQGKGSEANATTTTVADGATIKADAVTNGNGGKVVVWADGTTNYYGTISAQGGRVSGNGGSAEVSGKQTLLYKGYTDLRATNGTTGTLLLDPGEYIISTDATSGNVYNVTELGNQLNSANITLATDGTGTGNITVAADLTNWTSGNTLTLKANNDIDVNATIKSTGSGDVVLRADSDANDSGTVNFGTNGKVVTDGAVSIYYNPSGTTTTTINGTSTTVKDYSSLTDYSSYVKTTSGDNGSLTAYMLVNNVNQLQAISLQTNGAAYALGGDIDASATKNWNNGAGFVPINSDWGLVVEGDGHVISGLYINDRTDDNVGLFGYVNDATIRNLGLKDVNINSGKGGQNVGALVGYLSGAGSATNCYVTGGTVTGYLGSADSTVGGLVGDLGTFKGLYSCYSVTTVQGYNARCVGGLVGESLGGTISNSYSTSTVTGSGSGSYIGGLVGSAVHSWYIDDDLFPSTILNSYSSGMVTGTGSNEYVGGLVGYNGLGWITSSYSTAAVTSTGSGSYVGGLVGRTRDGWNSYITSSYSSGTVTSTGSGSFVGGFSGGSEDPDNNNITDCYWDSDSSGQQNGSSIGNIAGLTALSTSGTDPYTKSSYSGFDFGTTWYMVDGYTRPFLQWEYSTAITNAHQLQLMVENLSANYTLAANIDLKNFDMGRNGGFVTIGSSTSAFTGSLDGNGYAINNLTITGTTADAIGLFGYIGAGATVSNVGLYNVNITGVTNNTYVGSLAGYNAGTITNVYSTGTVSGYGTVGGLVGLNNGTVQNAYTTAKVVGNGSGSKAGGLAGENDGKITNVYSTGNVSGTTGSTVGGLVGYASSDSIIANSYWDTGTSGQQYGVGNDQTASGVTGLTTAQMMDETYLEGLGFDFTDTWYMIDGYTRPFFNWECSTTITNAHQLQLMAKDLSATYTLGSNIDLSELSDASGMWRTSTTADSNGNYGFVPIGSSSAPFTGTLYGKEHTISGLIINNSALTAVGLFGYTEAATINNISLKNVTITTGSGSYVGGLVGENDGSIFNACLIGTAILNGGTAGGLVGLNSGTIIDCYNSSAGTATGSIVGGLVGTNSGSVTSSYNAASIAASGDGGIVGGLVGTNDGSITNSYNAGNVSVSGDGSTVGGVTGINTATGSITGSYNAGIVTGSGNNEKVGGVAGSSAGSITNSYNADYVAASGDGSTIGGVTGINTDTGSIVYSYNGGTVIGSGSNEQIGGVAGENAGSISGSYNAASVAASSFGSTIGGVTGVNTKTGSIISSYGAAAGTVSSNADSNLVGGVAGENDGSILGSFNNGEVNTTASATNNKVGGLVGLNAADGSLTKSYNTGTVSVSGDNSLTGGLAGENDGSMTSTTNAGAVASTGAASPTGGLAGINSGSITTSYSVGNVSGYYNVGGLVGTNAGSITDSYYAIATVTGYGSTSKTGGLAGVNGGTIATSYNSGGVTGGGLTGGLVGDGTGGTITSVVWDINKSGQQYGVGTDPTAAGVTGLTTYQMSKAANYPDGWDFTNTWTLTATGPRLQWQDQTNLTITTLSTIDAAAATSIDNTLNSGTDVTLVTSQGSANSGDIDVDSALSWASGKTLTLSAYRDVNVNTSITSTGGGNVVLRADNTGNDSGTVNFGSNGKVVTDGAVSIYYNPVGTTSTTINGIGILVKNFADPTDYSAYVKSTSGGTGNLTTYMLVNNVTELQAIQVNLGGTYALGKDIDASATYSWNSGAGFTTFCGNNPDWGGDSSAPFTGIFDGDGHVISGLYINSSDYNSGLFGYVRGTVRNLGLENVSITGSGTWNGALAGYNTGTITNCYVTGTVTGSNEDGIGGLIGYSKGTITGSYSTASVQATNVQYVGGLVGENDGHITDSYSTGATSSTGSAFTGGLVGYNSGGTISDSYSTGVVTSDVTVEWFSHAGTGGLVGYNTNGGTITDSYSVGEVTGNVTITGGYSDAGTGGLVGENYGGTISESYSTGTVTGSVTITGDSSYAGTGGLVGYNSGGTIADSYSTGAVTDNDSVAYVGGLAGYNVNGGTISGSYSAGEVTGRGSYVGGFIGSTDNADNITASYWDIDSSGQQNGSGDGSSITGLTALSASGTDPYTESSYGGFDFGTTWYMVDGSTRPFLRWEYSTTITNAHQLQLMAMDLSANYTLATNIDLTGYNMARSGFSPIGTSSTPFTGSLDGNGYAVNNLTITSLATDAVGLFGYIGQNAIVSNIGLYNVDIAGGTASAYVGSLAGYNAGTITNAYSTGSVSGSGTVGGLVGLNNGTVEFSYATAQVDVDGSSGKAGGLVGENDKLIGNAYSTGKISGDPGSTLGGLVGYAGSGSTICDSGWDTDTSGIGGTQGVGNVINSAGVTGLTTVQMMDKDYLTALGFDFTNTWYMVDGATRPFLRSENVTSISNAHQLQLMGANLSATYILDSDINLSELTNASGMWNIATGFVPVGSSSTPFTGVVFGGGHTISGLIVNNPDLTAAGLFGYIKDATINNLSLSDVTITAGSGSYVGSLVGENDGGSIINAGLNGAAILSGGAAGGLVGLNTGSITGSYTNTGALVSVSGATEQVGGVAGINSGTIINSYNAGTVTGSGANEQVGGVAGANTGTIINSYNAGTVTGSGDNEQVGGVAGTNTGSITGSYTKTGATVNVSGDGSLAGGVTGSNAAAGTISNSYNAGTVSGIGVTEQVGGVAGANAGTITSCYNANAGGSVSISGDSSDAGGVAGVNTGTITSSYNAAGQYAVNSLGYDSSNITVAAGTVTGSGTNEQVGGVVGQNAGSITSSYNGGVVSISGDKSAVGGVAGDNTGTISQSYNAEVKTTGNYGTVSAAYTEGKVISNAADSVEGGVVGINVGAVTACYNWGTVTATGAGITVGGLAGWNQLGGSISNSYSGPVIVTVSGDGSIAGGLVGQNDGSIDYTYAVTPLAISGENRKAGGLVGVNGLDGKITNSFWDTEIADVNRGIGSGTSSGVTGLTTAQMMQSSTYTGWDLMLFPTIAYNNSNSYYYPVSSLTTSWTTLDGCSFPFFSWQYGTYIKGEACNYPFQFISGTVKDGGAGETVVIKGSNTTSAKTISSSGFYYTIAAGNTAGKLMVLYVTGDDNYKANAWYRTGINGLANADLIKDTLIDSAEVAAQNCSFLLSNSPTVPAADSVYTCSNGVLSVNGNLIIDYCGDANTVFMINSPVIATGDITVDAGNGNLLIDDLFTKIYASNYYYGGGKLTAGGNITIIANNGFYNNAGADALQLTGSGRWLIYGSDPLLDQSDMLYYFQNKFIQSYQSIQKTWSGTSSAAWYPNAWMKSFQSYMDSNWDMYIDGRGGLTGNFTQWDTAYGGAVPATGSGFVYTELEPAIRPLTSSQQLMVTAIDDAHTYNADGQAPVVPAAASSLMVTINGEGVATEPTDSVRLTEEPPGESDKLNQDGTGPTID